MSQQFGSPQSGSGTGGTSETASSIKQKLLQNLDTNNFSDADKQKLDGIESVTIATDIESFTTSFLNALNSAQTPRS